MPGIRYGNIDSQSTMRLAKEQFTSPQAASNTILLNAASISASAAGDTFTIATYGVGGKPLRYPRKLTVTSHDNSGTNLSITLKITGKRFGNRVVDRITATGTGGGQTITGTKVFDEINEIKVDAIANNAASDTVSVGIDGTTLGLRNRIGRVTDVKLVHKISNGTPDATGCVPVATVQATDGSVVDVANSAINFSAAYHATAIAVTDIYEVEYMTDSNDEFFPSGWRA